MDEGSLELSTLVEAVLATDDFFVVGHDFMSLEFAEALDGGELSLKAKAVFYGTVALLGSADSGVGDDLHDWLLLMKQSLVQVVNGCQANW